jgi:hypothetical protein
MHHNIFLLITFIFFLTPLSSFAQINGYQIDALVHPRSETMVITVGGDTADIPGFTSSAIAQAVDILTNNQGGIVKLNPGLFEITGPVRLTSNISLIGSGSETVLKKVDGIRTPFIIDADWGELKLTVANAAGFESGMGVQIYDEKQNGGWAVTTAVITAVDRNVVYVDTYLVRDYIAGEGSMFSNACSIISAVGTDKVRIADLVVDGNKSTNDYMNGCRGGAVYVHKSTNTLIENIQVRDFNGDGISWQLTENVIVRNCEISGCTNSGLHPGTGSPKTLIENNNSHHNGSEGLFICWRVHHGVVRNNRFHHNRRFGICTGHKDTDMLFEKNHIYENGSDGINFRAEKTANAPHRNTFIGNTIENNGTEKGGYGFLFNSPSEEIVIKDNIIRDTGAGSQKAAVYITRNGLPVKLEQNRISGHKNGEIILEKDIQ